MQSKVGLKINLMVNQRTIYLLLHLWLGVYVSQHGDV